MRGTALESLLDRAITEIHMAGNSIKNKPKYKALKRKGMSKARAARIANSGKASSRKGGRKAAAKRRSK
jgi:hypothetical protein